MASFSKRTTLGATSACKGIVRIESGFVAACTNAIYHTTDAGPWQATPAVGMTYTDVAFDGRTLVAVGLDGLVRSSSDASEWTTHETGTTRHLRSVTWSGARFVTTGDGGTVLWSADGQSWTTGNSGVSDALRGIAHDGQRFLAVGRSNQLLSSLDGERWEASTLSDDQGPAAAGIACHDGVDVVAGERGEVWVRR